MAGCLLDSPDDEQVDRVEQEFTGSRSDHTATRRPSAGHWGDWTQPLYCNEGSWAVGYQMRVEASQGTNKDDTALNTVQLQCLSRDAASVEWIRPHDGIWGTWGAAVSCSATNNFLSSARMRVEPNLGSNRDDTAANDIEFGCSGGGSISAGNGAPWGAWTSWNYCPAGSAVCGLSIRVEANQGSNRDDTTMNGLELYCCAL